jgi:hypothetical protein
MYLHKAVSGEAYSPGLGRHRRLCRCAASRAGRDAGLYRSFLMCARFCDKLGDQTMFTAIENRFEIRALE